MFDSKFKSVFLQVGFIKAKQRSLTRGKICWLAYH